MINIYEKFDDKTILLYRSFENSSINNINIVLEDDGFLPFNIFSPYRYFTKEKKERFKPLYFNEVPVPEYWEIKGDNKSAKIMDKGKIRGKIIYKKNIGQSRIVDKVEWLSEDGQLKYVDFYNQQGFRFAQLLYDEFKMKILKRYFDKENNVVIVENFVTKDIILNYNDKNLFFNNKKEFYSYYLSQLEVPKNHILINSLSYPFLTTYSFKEEVVNYKIVWQENIKDSIPDNMKVALKHIKNIEILVPNQEEYHKIVSVVENNDKEKITKSGYVYNFKKDNHFKKNIFILTNSDDIPFLSEIVDHNPEFNFKVAALTEMSSKLMGLDTKKNIKLYPKISNSAVSDLLKESDIYLDINKGNEVLNIIERAFSYQLLIFAFKETAHNSVWIDDSNIFEINNYKALISKINKLNNLNGFKLLLEKQLSHADIIDKEEFVKLLN